MLPSFIAIGCDLGVWQGNGHLCHLSREIVIFGTICSVATQPLLGLPPNFTHRFGYAVRAYCQNIRYEH